MVMDVFQPDGPTFLELMEQALSSTERGYDLVATKFDRTPFRTPEPIVVEMAKQIGEVDDALDVCCGTGAALGALRLRARRRVVGLDFSQGMLDEAKRRLASTEGTAAIELVLGDALAMPFDNEFDAVTSVGAFGHILREDEDRFLAGIFRALRPGGSFVFVTSEVPSATTPWFWMAHGFNAVMRVRNALLQSQFIMYYLTFMWPEIRQALVRAGFEVNAERDVFPKPYQRAILVRARKPPA